MIKSSLSIATGSTPAIFSCRFGKRRLKKQVENDFLAVSAKSLRKKKSGALSLDQAELYEYRHNTVAQQLAAYAK